MKNLTILLILSLVPFWITAQILEVEGKAKITDMDKVNTADSVVVRLADGTLAVRDVSSLKASFSEDLLDAGLNGVVEDIDGNKYKTIKIGDQVFMAENLKTTRYNDGTAIPLVTDNTAWSNLTTPAYSWYANDSIMNAKLFGALYNYYTVADTNSLNVCPIGWHVPTDAEWTVLTEFLEDNGYGFGGTSTDIGKSMASTFRWTSSSNVGDIGNDQGTNNSSSFSGLPGGLRSANGTFFSIGNNGNWWGYSQFNASSALSRSLSYFNDFVFRFPDNKGLGFSVRCLRDSN